MDNSSHPVTNFIDSNNANIEIALKYTHSFGKALKYTHIV